MRDQLRGLGPQKNRKNVIDAQCDTRSSDDGWVGVFLERHCCVERSRRGRDKGSTDNGALRRPLIHLAGDRTDMVPVELEGGEG